MSTCRIRRTIGQGTVKRRLERRQGGDAERTSKADLAPFPYNGVPDEPIVTQEFPQPLACGLRRTAGLSSTRRRR